MRIKILPAAIFMCILSLSGLLFLSVRTEAKGYQDFNLVLPDGAGFPPLDLREINNINTQDVTLTYEIRKRGMAEAGNITQPVTLVGINSSYAHMIGLSVVEGSFISDAVWAMGSHYVVLNEPAAYQLFGSNRIIGNTVKLDGELWMVTGIVRDGKKKEGMAYVPAHAIAGAPEVLMAKASGGTGAVLSSLRSLGIYESNCRVIDVSAVALLFRQQFSVAVYIGIGLFSLLQAIKITNTLRGNLHVLRQRYKNMYLDELIQSSQRELKKLACQSMLTALSMTAFLLSARQILAIVLKWKHTGREITYLSDYFFQEKMQWLLRYLVSGPILFSVFMIAICMILIALIHPPCHHTPPENDASPRSLHIQCRHPD